MVSSAGTLSAGEMIIDYSAFDPAFYTLHDVWIDLGSSATVDSVEIMDGAMIAEIIDGLIHLSGDGSEIYDQPKIAIQWTATVPTPGVLGLLAVAAVRRRRRRS
jgi:MYXO-CTERM domain-containing protein